MDITAFTTLISNVGFPIACVAVMFWAQNKERDAHAEESKTWADVVRQNTEAVNDLREVVSLLKEKIGV